MNPPSLPIGPDDSDVPDLELARRCQAGDRAAQRALMDRLRTSVHRTLYRILGSRRNSTDMEDLLQDTLVAVFRSLRTFRGEARLTTWGDQIATRVAYGYLSRRRLREVSLEGVADISTGNPMAERRLFFREAARRLYAVLDQIEPSQRIAFTLHTVDGRALRDVAAATNSSVLAVKARLWRARRHIDRHARRDSILASIISGKPWGQA